MHSGSILIEERHLGEFQDRLGKNPFLLGSNHRKSLQTKLDLRGWTGSPHPLSHQRTRYTNLRSSFLLVEEQPPTQLRAYHWRKEFRRREKKPITNEHPHCHSRKTLAALDRLHWNRLLQFADAYFGRGGRNPQLWLWINAIRNPLLHSLRPDTDSAVLRDT